MILCQYGFVQKFINSSALTFSLSRSLSISNVVWKKRKSITEEIGLPDLPERPKTPYIQFCLKENKMYSHLSPKDRTRKLGDLWNNLPDAKKSDFLEEYYKSKVEYTKKFQNYLAQLTPEQYVKLDKAAKTRKLEVDLKKEKKKELENLRKPKHPGNAFILFLNTLPNAADKPRREFLVEAAAKWKSLPEQKKEAIKEESRGKLLRYERELLAWEERMKADGRSDLLRKNSPASSVAPLKKVVKKS